MRRFLSVLLILSLLFSLGGAALAADDRYVTPELLIAPAPQGSSGSAPQEDSGVTSPGNLVTGKKDIVILHTNDVHGEYKANIGYAGLAAYRAELEASNYVALVDAGDFTQGAAISILSKGEYLVDIINRVGYDVVVPGNHEFDYGIEQAMKNLNGVSASVLACNFIDLAAGTPVFDAYRVMSFGDTKVGFVGIATPETYRKSTPTHFMDAEGNYLYSFSEGDGFYSVIQAAVDAARADGAQYVIAVGHCGVDAQSGPWTSRNIIANTTGIDVFIDGHSHTEIENETVRSRDGKPVILAQTGEKLSKIGKVTISADGGIRAELISDWAEKDAGLETWIAEEIESNYSAYTSQIVAESKVDLNGVKADVRTRETNMGDLIADAYRVVLGADIGLMNGGGIRASIPAGKVTISDILAVMTFGNMATVKTVRGSQIRDCLEMGVASYPGAAGGFTHVSGLSYCIDPDTPSSVEKDDKGSFKAVTGAYRVYDIRVNGEPLDPEKEYTVACHSYWLNSYGDGMEMFRAGETVSEKHELYVDNVLLMKYIQENLEGVIGEEYAEAQGRIVIDPFSDVLASDWFAPYVTELYAGGIINGMSASEFAPNASISRAMIVTMLYRLAGSPAMTGAKADLFSDVGSDWYTDAVLWAAQNGIVNGYEDGSFRPNRQITREELACILYRCAKLQGLGFTGSWMFLLDFSDRADISSWADEAMHWCVMKGILNGFGDGSLRPKGTATRAQAAKMICVLTDAA